MINEDLLFGRKEFALNISSLLNTLDKNNNVVAIDSKFGTGKTFFSKYFKKTFGE